ncbi:FtsW/RodA/SpoVE family cell cycle protein, partial [Victivallis sp.]
MRKYRSGSSGILDAGTVVQILVFLLGLWGVLTIASSQSASPTALLIGKQLGALVGGMAVMLAAARIPFDFYRRQIWVLALLFFLPLLILPLAGVRVNGMCGWFRIGSFSLQPTEPAKGIFLLTLVVTMTSLRSENLRFWGALAVAGIWLVPIFLQPDFGTSAIYLAGFAAVYFLAGGRVRNLLIFCTGAA